MSTLYARSYDNWYVVARMNNKKGDGAVKTYPNVHRDYGSVPIGSFDSITSSFAETSPHVGIYNVAYDIWMNGIARPGCTEIMIWNENFNQVPGGRYVQDVSFGGRSYKVYKTPNSGYLAFVATTNFTSGTVNLLDIIKWAIAKGWLPSKSTLNQICFGVEIVSTDDADATFQVTRFSIDAKLRAGARSQCTRKRRDQPDTGEQRWPEQRTEDEMTRRHMAVLGVHSSPSAAGQLSLVVQRRDAPRPTEACEEWEFS